LDDKIKADALALILSIEKQIKDFRGEMRVETIKEIKQNSQALQDQTDQQDVKIDNQSKHVEE
jgi:hypothetical protein